MPPTVGAFQLVRGRAGHLYAARSRSAGVSSARRRAHCGIRHLSPRLSRHRTAASRPRSGPKVERSDALWRAASLCPRASAAGARASSLKRRRRFDDAERARYHAHRARRAAPHRHRLCDGALSAMSAVLLPARTSTRARLRRLALCMLASADLRGRPPVTGAAQEQHSSRALSDMPRRCASASMPASILPP